MAIFNKKNNTENDKAIISLVVNKFEDYKKDRLPFELMWRLNISFIKGDQYNTINALHGAIEEITPFSYWEEREVFNKLAPTLETRLAKLARTDVNLKVRPATSESKDISTAKVETNILSGIDQKAKLTTKQLEANTWCEKTGSVVWKTTWSPNKGRVIGHMPLKETEEETTKEDVENLVKGVEKPTTRTIREGDIQIEYVSPFEIYPDSNARANLSECRSIIHARVYHVDEVYEIWGARVQGTDNNVFGLKNTYGGIGSMGRKGSNYSVATSTMQNSVVVMEYWEKPSRNFPQGRLIICTENQLLHLGKLPFQLGEDGEYELPFDLQQSIMNPEYVWGDSIFTRLIPIQRRYNSVRNRVKEYLNRVAIGNLLAEEGSIDDDLIDEGIEPGQVIPYKRGHTPPQFMNNHSLPSAFGQEKMDCDQDLIQISGVSEISRDSNAPVGVGSGVALALLKEQDDTRIAFTASNLQNTRISVGKKVLMLYKQYADVQRTIRCVGKNETVTAIEFDTNTITSFDIIIEASAKLAETPAQRRQFVTELLQYGLFNDPKTGNISKQGRKKVFEMLEMGNWESFDSDDDLHIQKAKRENTKFLEGQQCAIRQFDDDEAHIQEHNNLRLTGDYEELVAKNPIIEQLIEEHVNMHVMNLQQKAMSSGGMMPQEGEENESSQQ